MNNKWWKLLFILLGLLIVVAFYKFNLSQYLTLESLKDNRLSLISYYQNNKAFSITAYFTIYIVTAALSLPGATILSLAGGAIFGLFVATILVSFASTIGATLAFLLSRYFLRNYIQKQFGNKLKVVNEGIKKDGAFYLLTLRLVPIFPFFIINLVMGLTPIKTIVFFFTSQIGMLLGTIVYINAGVEIAKITSLKGILSPSLLISFALLGIFPLAAKKIVDALKKTLRP